MNPGVTLVGDGLENPANALVMMQAARMFGATCRFRDTRGLAELPELSGRGLMVLGDHELETLHARRIAFDNLPGAKDLFGFSAGKDFALMVGNERRGLSYEITRQATDRVHIPMFSRKVNCLNVAAASGVALYYLSGKPSGPMAIRRDPANRRPEVMLVAAGDHFELGSSIRSAAAFGWHRVLIEDRRGIWFDCDRVVRSEGRAAARRGKNDILCVPCPALATDAFPRVTVITTKTSGIPFHRLNLAGGPSQLVVIPDESQVDVEAETWSRLGREVEFGCLKIPATDFTYHYRIAASIALAEITRQVGRPLDAKGPAGIRPPIYDRKLARVAETAGARIDLDWLMEF